MPEEIAECMICHHSVLCAVEPFVDKKISTSYCACERCGLVQMNPRPTVDELDQYYDNAYWTERPGDQKCKREKQSRRSRFIIAFLERYLTAGGGQALHDRENILEIGSSFGMLLYQLDQRIRESGRSSKLHAIEPNRAVVEANRVNYEHVTIIGTTLQQLDATNDQSFDLVVLSHVLEHLPDPVASLKSISARIAPEGAVFIEVPNYYGHPSGEYAHNFCFTETSLRNCLSMAGMRPFALEVNGHDESFPFYLTCLATNDKHGPAICNEACQQIISSRKSAMEAFLQFRAKQPRPA